MLYGMYSGVYGIWLGVHGVWSNDTSATVMAPSGFTDTSASGNWKPTAPFDSLICSGGTNRLDRLAT